jgi:hypothetical protein
MDAKSRRVIAPFTFKLSSLEQNLLVKTEAQDRSSKFILEFELLFHSYIDVPEKEILISNTSEGVVETLDSPLKKTKIGESDSPILKQMNKVTVNGIRDQIRKSRPGSRDFTLEPVEGRRFSDVQRERDSPNPIVHDVRSSRPPSINMSLVDTPPGSSTASRKESIDSMTSDTIEVQTPPNRHINHPSHPMEFSDGLMRRFSNVDETVSPRGSLVEVTPIDLNDDIEENDRMLGEILENTPRMRSDSKSSLYTKGWMQKSKNGTTLSTDTWEMRYLMYDVEKQAVTIAVDKTAKPIQSYTLKAATTLLFHGSEISLKEKRYLIRISLNMGAEYISFSTDNIDDFYKWLTAFSHVQKCELQLLKERRPSKRTNPIDIRYYEYTIWREPQVKEWIKSSLFFFEDKHINMVTEAIELNNVVGVQLNNEFDLKKFFVNVPKEIIEEMNAELQLAIGSLRIEKVFDKNKFLVAQKIYKAWPDQFKANRLHYLNLASNISSAKGLHNFLSSDQQSIRDMIDKGSNEKSKRVKVKLVITNTTYPQTFKRFLSPILNPISFINVNYGIFHTALIIGPYYLDWNSSELCVPKRIMKSTESFFTTDISEIPVHNYDLDTVVKKISEIISQWNTTYSYGNFKIGNARNCQDFVEEVLKSLGIAWNPTSGGAIEKFMNSLKKGNEGAKFFASDAFDKCFANDKFISDKRNWEFTTHEELDKFAIALKKNKNVEREFPEEWNLLKSFDRGFWLKFYGETTKKEVLQSPKKLSELSPLKVQGENCDCCPFGDPKTTGSFR